MAKKSNKNVMKIYDGQNNELMTVRKLEKDGHDLLITGKIFGAMPMKARLTPQEARAAFKVMDFKTLLFLVTLLFRPSTKLDD
ncbi:MAG: hypothetical protein COA43_01510 [Robiginitomaculum sp.]|nr:MAG: hypothetical protein COA43_01510 [Robiginitomaculum sp.]